MIDEAVRQELYQLIGWTIIHFFWQGACIGAIVAVLLLLWPTIHANRRYVLLCIGFLLLACCPLGTLIWLNADTNFEGVISQASAIVVDAENDIGDQAQAPLESVTAFSAQPNLEKDSSAGDSSNLEPSHPFDSFSFADWPLAVSHWSPWLVLVWGIGVILLSIRLILSWVATQKMKTTGIRIESPEPFNVLVKLCDQLRLNQKIKLLQSDHIDTPVVIGWLHPVILLPASAYSGLTIDQLTAVLAHELAHIRRHDYLVNLLQTFVEVLLFFHPVVWWMSKEIRKERENCCDDIAVEACGNRRDYVEALLQLEQQRSVPPPLALAANSGTLVQRMARIIGTPRPQRQLGNWYCGFATLIVAGLVLLILLPVQTTTAQPEVANAEQEIDGTVQDDIEEEAELTIFVLDANGDPIPDTSLLMSVVTENPTAVDKFNLVTDADGTASQVLSRKVVTLRVWATAKTFAPVFAKWEREYFASGKKLPTESTMVLLPAETIGGKILDEKGEPVAGAKVQVTHRSGGLPLPVKGQRYNRWLAYGEGAAVTDTNGIWVLENIPPGDDVEVSLTINHPDFVSDEREGGLQTEQSISMKDLANLTAKIKMKRGARVFGTVKNSKNEKPVSNALIVWGDNPYYQQGSQEFKVNEKGEYRFPTMKPGSSMRVTVLAEGFEPQSKVVDIREGMPATDFSMKPGKKLQIQFVDKQGNPIPNVYVSVESWRGSKAMYNNQHPNVVDSKIPWHSDSNGLYTWDWAPSDPVTFNFGARKYASRRNVELAAADEPHEIQLNKKIYLSGTVSNEQGKNLEAFTVIPMTVLSSSAHERREDAFIAKDGFFEVESPREDAGFKVKIEANGYQTHVTNTYRIGDEIEPLEIVMKKVELLEYWVIDVDGTPAQAAEVLIAESDERLMLSFHEGRPANRDGKKITTNEKGLFKLEPASKPRTIIVRSENGYREVADLPDRPVKKIELEPWYEISAQVSVDGQFQRARGSGAPIRFIHGTSMHIQQQHYESANSDELIVFKKLPPMPFSFRFSKSRNLDPRDRRYAIAIEPNSASEEIRCECNIHGQVEISGAHAENVDFVKSKIEFRSKTPAVRIPPELEKLLKKKRIAPEQHDAVFEYLSKKENWGAVNPYLACFDRYSILLDAEGRFDLSAMRPGEYEMKVTLNPKSNDRPFLPLGEFSKTIQVKKSGTDLRTFNVSTFPVPAPGSKIEDLMFTNRATGIPSWLTASQGRYVLVDFWKPWGEQSKQDQPRLTDLGKKLAPEKISILSLHSYNRTDGKRAPGNKLAVQWIEGQVPLTNLRTYRKKVAALTPQHYLLIDAEGKFVCGFNDLKKIEEKVRELELLK